MTCHDIQEAVSIDTDRSPHLCKMTPASSVYDVTVASRRCLAAIFSAATDFSSPTASDATSMSPFGYVVACQQPHTC